MAMIDDDDNNDDDDDVAINEISNNMKLPIYAVLVGRVSFLHTLIVVLVCFWSVVFVYVVFISSLLGKEACAQCRLKKRTFIKIKSVLKLCLPAFHVKQSCVMTRWLVLDGLILWIYGWVEFKRISVPFFFSTLTNPNPFVHSLPPARLLLSVFCQHPDW